VSITAIRQVLAQSRAKGTTRFVLVILAEAANEAKVTRGDPWEVWPSQATIAAKAGVSPRAVRRHLVDLVSLGEIREVGRVGRGCVRYEITLAVPEPRTEASRVDGSVQGEAQASLDPGRERPGGRTLLHQPRTEASAVPRTEASAEPEGEPELLEQEETESVAGAPDASPPIEKQRRGREGGDLSAPELRETIAELRDLAGGTSSEKLCESTERRAKRHEEELDRRIAELEVDSAAGRLADALAAPTAGEVAAQ